MYENGAVGLSDMQRRLIEVNRQVAMHRKAMRQETLVDMAGSPTLVTVRKGATLSAEQVRIMKENREAAVLRRVEKRAQEQTAEDTEASAAEPKNKSQKSFWVRAGLDDAEGAQMAEPDFQPEEDETQSDPENFEEQAENSEQIGEDRLVRTRLRAKTSPINAPAYPQRPLLRKAEYKVKKGQLKEAQRKEWAKYKAARNLAVAALSNQTEFGASWKDDDGIAENFEEVPKHQVPHPSHHISYMANSEVIFCRACACWSLRSRLRGLEERCTGLKEGSASTLRLLQCGVQPAPGARLPPRCRKRRARKSRW